MLSDFPVLLSTRRSTTICVPGKARERHNGGNSLHGTLQLNTVNLDTVRSKDGELRTGCKNVSGTVHQAVVRPSSVCQRRARCVQARVEPSKRKSCSRISAFQCGTPTSSSRSPRTCNFLSWDHGHIGKDCQGTPDPCQEPKSIHMTGHACVRGS